MRHAYLGQLRAIGDQVPAYANAGFTSPITSFTLQEYSSYNTLPVNFKKRFAKGLEYQAAYTWSHLIDNSTAEVASARQFLPGGSINNANTVNNFLCNVQAYVTVSNPLFNNPSNTFSTSSRVFQISGRFFWLRDADLLAGRIPLPAVGGPRAR